MVRENLLEFLRTSNLLCIFVAQFPLFDDMLVTDTSYCLPDVLAMESGAVFTTGANCPLLIRGFCEQSGCEGDYVLKGSGGERMGPPAFERELLGCFTAWQVGLQTVEPVKVTVTDEFVQSMKGNANYSLVHGSLGHNYGSTYRPGMREFVTNQPLSHAEMEQAKLIFAFDVLIQNTDRRVGKQNMLTDGTNVLLLDHELAFSFTKALFPISSPWLIPDADLFWIRNHYFFPQLRGKRIDFRPLSVNLTRLNATFWQQARRHIPPEWRTSEGSSIELHISQMVAHVEEFTEHLNRITS